MKTFVIAAAVFLSLGLLFFAYLKMPAASGCASK